MNPTNRLALKAKKKAESMGWEVLIKLDQSDVIDMATVVAWAPGSAQARYICFVDGHESAKGWRHLDKLDGLLEYCLCYR